VLVGRHFGEFQAITKTSAIAYYGLELNGSTAIGHLKTQLEFLPKFQIDWDKDGHTAFTDVTALSLDEARLARTSVVKRDARMNRKSRP